MIETIAKKIADAQLKHPSVFIGIFVLITLLLAPGIFLLVGNVEPSLEKVLPQDIEEVQLMNDMRSDFGADMMYILIYPESPVYDVRNPQLLQYMDTISKKILTNPSVLYTASIVDEVKAQNNGEIPNDLHTIENQDYSFSYINVDYSLAIIQVTTDTGASAQKITEVVNAIESDIATLESMNPGSRISITGFNVIDKVTFEVIMSDFASITAVSMLLIAIVVFFTFKSLTKGMLPMIVVMVALLWTMGIVGYLGLTITVVSMVAAAMIMGLGIDFGIHVLHTYYEQRKKGNPKVALELTLQELVRAMIAASLTTIAGFLALLAGVLAAMKTLAIILAVGIFTTLLGALFLLPVIVYLYDRRKKK